MINLDEIIEPLFNQVCFHNRPRRNVLFVGRNAQRVYNLFIRYNQSHPPLFNTSWSGQEPPKEQVQVPYYTVLTDIEHLKYLKND